MANMLEKKDGNAITNKNDKPITMLGSVVYPGQTFFIPKDKIAEAINDINAEERNNLIHDSVLIIKEDVL